MINVKLIHSKKTDKYYDAVVDDKGIISFDPALVKIACEIVRLQAHLSDLAEMLDQLEGRCSDV